MRDEFGFTQLTLMGKDTQRILWFISEVMYQTYFCRSPYTALKLTRLMHNSSIYNFFVRFTGFVLIFFLYIFFTIASSERGVGLQCQLGTFIFCSCPVFCNFFIYIYNMACTIYPHTDFLPLTHRLMSKRTITPPHTHTNMLLLTT